MAVTRPAKGLGTSPGPEAAGAAAGDGAGAATRAAGGADNTTGAWPDAGVAACDSSSISTVTSNGFPSTVTRSFLIMVKFLSEVSNARFLVSGPGGFAGAQRTLCDE
jgi:hypothetical protein